MADGAGGEYFLCGEVVTRAIAPNEHWNAPVVLKLEGLTGDEEPWGPGFAWLKAHWWP